MPKLAIKPVHKSNGSLNKGLAALAVAVVSKPSGLARLKDVKQPAKPSGPLWLGPMDSSPMGGITQSIISSMIVDKERARIKLIEGLKEDGQFSTRMEFGNLWHVAEENFLAGKPYEPALLAYAKKLVAKHGNAASAEISKWHNVCLVQFPKYIEFWKKNKDVVKRVPVEQEQVFHVPYTLPSGRVVYLRGKRDSVDIIGKQVFIGEHKTKGEINKEQLLHFLKLDLQNNFYLTAAYIDPALKEKIKNLPIAGVRYNVILRPLSGGKHSIRQKQGQTEVEFYKELGDRIGEDGNHFFARFNCELTPTEVKGFQDMCLNPILENACDDYEWWTECYSNPKLSPFAYVTRAAMFPQHKNRHYVVPFGIYSPLFDGGSTAMDDYILSGYKNTRGLVQATRLFEELINE